MSLDTADTSTTLLYKFARNEQFISGFTDSLDAVKGYCGKVRSMEIFYGYYASFKVGAELWTELEQCQNLIVRLRGQIGEQMQPFHTKALILEKAVCPSKILHQIFPSVTSVTTKVALEIFQKSVEIGTVDNQFGNQLK